MKWACYDTHVAGTKKPLSMQQDLAEALGLSFLLDEMEPFAWPVLIGVGAVCYTQSTQSRSSSLITPGLPAQAEIVLAFEDDSFQPPETFRMLILFIYIFALDREVEITEPIAWIMAWRSADREMMDTGACALWLWWLRQNKWFFFFPGSVQREGSIKVFPCWTLGHTHGTCIIHWQEVKQWRTWKNTISSLVFFPLTVVKAVTAVVAVH